MNHFLKQTRVVLSLLGLSSKLRPSRARPQGVELGAATRYISKKCVFNRQGQVDGPSLSFNKPIGVWLKLVDAWHRCWEDQTLFASSSYMPVAFHGYNRADKG